MNITMTTPTHPSISVIIPTFNRKQSLLCTLESLRHQTYPVEKFEGIVVNDGGDDVSHHIADTNFPFRLRLCRQTNQGAAAARNYAARQSAAEVLVFIDDDITLEPGYLAAVAQKTAPGVLTMGSWLPFIPPGASVFTRTLARSAMQIVQTDDQDVPFTECTSNNLAICRTDFFQLGMWQDLLGDGPSLWADVAFGYVAWKSGRCFRRIADARLTHRDTHVVSLSSATRRAYHVANISQPLLHQYPEIRGHLSMFRNKAPINWRQDSLRLVVRKLCCQIGWSSPAMLLMEHSVSRLERLAPETQLLNLLYRWIISGYIYRGYRDGLREIRQGTP